MFTRISFSQESSKKDLRWSTIVRVSRLYKYFSCIRAPWMDGCFSSTFSKMVGSSYSRSLSISISIF